MRTTIELSDALSRRVREAMKARKTTFKALVEEGLRRVLEDEPTRRAFRLRDASVGEGGVADGVVDATWDSFGKHLYPEE